MVGIHPVGKQMVAQLLVMVTGLNYYLSIPYFTKTGTVLLVIVDDDEQDSYTL